MSQVNVTDLRRGHKYRFYNKKGRSEWGKFIRYDKNGNAIFGQYPIFEPEFVFRRTKLNNKEHTLFFVYISVPLEKIWLYA